MSKTKREAKETGYTRCSCRRHGDRGTTQTCHRTSSLPPLRPLPPLPQIMGLREGDREFASNNKVSYAGGKVSEENLKPVEGGRKKPGSPGLGPNNL